MSITAPTYLFYDIETSGLSKPFDQVFQFAAIRTDLNLNEISRHEIWIKLKPDVIPSPLASITHQISLESLKNGQTEYQAMREIHALLNIPGTISIGYNTLTFDDEFLRFSFYRNLLTPYTHQYANNCSRMDLYPMTVMFYLFQQPSPLEWPMKDGAPSLKLEKISSLNKLATGQAHNAMTDVEATLELAKRFQKEPAMWNYLSGYFQKKTDEERQTKLPKVNFSNHQTAPTGLLVLPKLGTKFLYQAPVLGLGQHYHYKNQYGWLRLDLPELSNATLDNLSDKTFVVQKKLGEVGFLLPYQEKYQTHIKKDRLAIAQKNIKFLLENPILFNGIKEYWGHFKYPNYPNTDVQAGLYQSDFWTPLETRQIQAFHHAINPADKYQALLKINNLVIQTLGQRILARDFPEFSNGSLQENYLTHQKNIYSHDLADRPIDFMGKKQYGLADFQADFQTAEKRELDSKQKNLLAELQIYLQEKLAPKLTPGHSF